MKDLTTEVITYYGPDTDIEIEAKRQLAELERLYRLQAQPFLDILAREHARKLPKIFIVARPPSEYAEQAASTT